MECPAKIFNDPLILNLGGHDVPWIIKVKGKPCSLLIVLWGHGKLEAFVL